MENSQLFSLYSIDDAVLNCMDIQLMYYIKYKNYGIENMRLVTVFPKCEMKSVENGAHHLAYDFIDLVNRGN